MEKTNPAKELWEACTKGAIAFLMKHRVLRIFFVIFGVLIFTLGLLTAILWNVPLLTWLSGKEIAPILLAVGGYTLGVCYKSRKVE